MIDISASSIHRPCFMQRSCSTASMNSRAERKGRYSQSVLIRACDNLLVVITPTTSEDCNGGWGGARELMDGGGF